MQEKLCQQCLQLETRGDAEGARNKKSGTQMTLPPFGLLSRAYMLARQIACLPSFEKRMRQQKPLVDTVHAVNFFQVVSRSFDKVAVLMHLTDIAACRTTSPN